MNSYRILRPHKKIKIKILYKFFRLKEFFSLEEEEDASFYRGRRALSQKY